MKTLWIIVPILLFLPLTAFGKRDLEIKLVEGVILKPGPLCYQVFIEDLTIGSDPWSTNVGPDLVEVTTIFPAPITPVDQPGCSSVSVGDDIEYTCTIDVPDGGMESVHIFASFPTSACFSVTVESDITDGDAGDPNPGNNMDCVTTAECPPEGLIFSDGFECGHLLDWV